MKRIILFFFFCVSILASSQAQINVASYDTVHFKKAYINDIFSSLYWFHELCFKWSIRQRV
jgi:hypothetical protein